MLYLLCPLRQFPRPYPPRGEQPDEYTVQTIVSRQSLLAPGPAQDV